MYLQIRVLQVITKKNQTLIGIRIFTDKFIIFLQLIIIKY